MSKTSKKIEIADLAKEWLTLKDEQKTIERRLSELKKELEPYLEKQPDKNAELAGFRFTLIHSERESFKLSEAKEAIDNRTLRPYISLSSFTQIRTCSLGKSE